MPDIDERFRSLSTVNAPDLWTRIEAREPRPPKGSPRRWPAAVVAFAVAVASLTYAVSTFRGRNGGPTPSTIVTNGRIAFSGPSGNTSQIFTMEPDGSDIQQVTDLATGEDAFQPSWSPDGEWIAFIVQQSDRSNIFIVRSDGTALSQLTHDGEDFQPSWSPDGVRLAFSRADPELGTQDIWVMNADGDHAIALTHETDGDLALSPSWSPDGLAILFVSNRSGGTELYRMRSDGTDVAQLTSDDGFHGSPRYSPDGTQIAFAGDVNGPGIYLISDAGSKPQQLTHDLQVGPIDLAWSPDGRFLVYSTSAGGHSIDLYTVDPVDGSIHRLTTSGDVCCPAWQPLLGESSPSPSALGPKSNGAISFRSVDGAVYEVQPDGSGLRQLFPASKDVEQIAWSPDGTEIAWAGTVGGRFGIYVSGPDGSNARQLTDGANDGWPAWSPDGARILFSSTRDDPSVGPCPRKGEWNLTCPTDLYVMRIDGSDITRITIDPAPEYDPEWSPGGTRISYTKSDGSGTAINVVNVDGSDARQVSSARGGSDFRATWTPNGELVFASIRYEDWGILEVGADGLGEHEIVRLGAAYVDDPAVSPDGSLVAFMGCCFSGDESGGGNALYVMRSDGTGMTRIADVSGGVLGDIAWRPLAAGSEVPSPSAFPSGSLTLPPGESLPEGTVLLQVGEGAQVLSAGAAASSEVGRGVALDLSADGSSALVVDSDVTRLVEVDTATGDRTVVADEPTGIPQALWSPDGRTVAYLRGGSTLCVVDVASRSRSCFSDFGKVYWFDWSPDGRIVLGGPTGAPLAVYDRSSGSTTDLVQADDPAVVRTVEELGLGRPTAIQFQGPRWSPSSSYIATLAMVDTADGWSGNVVLVFDLAGHLVAHGEVSTEFSQTRDWAPTTDVFAYARGVPPYRIVEVREVDVTTGEDRSLLSTQETSEETVQGLAWSPSGTFLALVTVEPAGSGFVWRLRILEASTLEAVVDLISQTDELRVIAWAA
jgi:Tol biopolymer transport system component